MSIGTYCNVNTINTNTSHRHTRAACTVLHLLATYSCMFCFCTHSHSKSLDNYIFANLQRGKWKLVQHRSNLLLMLLFQLNKRRFRRRSFFVPVINKFCLNTYFACCCFYCLHSSSFFSTSKYLFLLYIFNILPYLLFR